MKRKPLSAALAERIRSVLSSGLCQIKFVSAIEASGEWPAVVLYERDLWEAWGIRTPEKNHFAEMLDEAQGSLKRPAWNERRSKEFIQMQVDGYKQLVRDPETYTVNYLPFDEEVRYARRAFADIPIPGAQFHVGLETRCVLFNYFYEAFLPQLTDPLRVENPQLRETLKKLKEDLKTRQAAIDQAKESERQAKIAPLNLECDRLAVVMREEGYTCPHCHARSTNMRYLDNRPKSESYLVCDRCGCSIRPKDLKIAPGGSR